MAGSTLDITGEEPPVVDRGHGTKALGPSDSSDSGSDIAGGSGTTIDVDPGLLKDPLRGLQFFVPELFRCNCKQESHAGFLPDVCS